MLGKSKNFVVLGFVLINCQLIRSSTEPTSTSNIEQTTTTTEISVTTTSPDPTQSDHISSTPSDVDMNYLQEVINKELDILKDKTDTFLEQLTLVIQQMHNCSKKFLLICKGPLLMQTLRLILQFKRDIVKSALKITNAYRAYGRDVLQVD